MNALLYARMSTKEQADRELSIPAQLEAMRRYIAAHRWQVLEDGEYVDKGESARTADRPQLQAALTRCRKDRRVDVLLVHKLDRLARSVADFAAIKLILKRHRVRLVSVVEGFDENPAGELVENIMASIAEFYSANLSQEVKKGLRQKLEQGEWPGYAPIGYWNRERQVVVDEERAPLITRAFEFYATGRYSYKGLADALTQQGLRTRSGRFPTKSLVETVLQNPFYCGVMRKRTSETGGAEVFEGKHPPLVSRHLFERVQAVIADHNGGADRQRKHVHLFAGALFCGVCGKRWSAEIQKGHVYYYCVGRKLNGEQGCPQRGYVRQEVIDRQVLKALQTMRLPEATERNIRLSLSRKNTTFAQEERSERARLTKLIDDAQARLAALHEKLLSGVVADEVYQQLHPQLINQRALLQEQLDALATSSATFYERLPQMLDLARHTGKVYQRENDDLKKRTVKMVFTNLTIRDGKLSANLKLPWATLAERPKRLKMLSLTEVLRTLFLKQPESFQFDEQLLRVVAQYQSIAQRGVVAMTLPRRFHC